MGVPSCSLACVLRTRARWIVCQETRDSFVIQQSCHHAFERSLESGLKRSCAMIRCSCLPYASFAFQGRGLHKQGVDMWQFQI